MSRRFPDGLRPRREGFRTPAYELSPTDRRSRTVYISEVLASPRALPHTSIRMTRILGVWLLLAVLMSANGIFRELALKPALGATSADIVSAMLGIAIILGITWWLFRPLAGSATRDLVRASVLLVSLTVAFEFLVGHFVDGKSWSELVANYVIWRGRLWPIVLATIALTPFLWGRMLADSSSRQARERA